MDREKGFMSFETFKTCVEWARRFSAAGRQEYVWLHGIGESLLHPELETFLDYASNQLPTVQLKLSTNMEKLTDDHIRILKNNDVRLHVSLHNPGKIGDRLVRANDIIEHVGVAPLQGASDWAGQVNWFKTKKPPYPCNWIFKGRGFILHTGEIVTCCNAGSGVSVVGHVDRLEDAVLSPIDLCKKCEWGISVGVLPEGE